MAAKKTEKLIYAHDTLEFVTVAVQYCVFLEQSEGRPKDEFVSTLLKLLPLLYMKASLLPPVESTGDFLTEDKVTEDDYNWIRRIIYDIMQDDDEYEDISMTDLGPDERRWHSVSEGLADIYQPLRNFVSVYQRRIEDCMHDALWEVMDNFELYWGQSLLDTLRRLHQIRYTIREETDEDTL
jgi:hypothetical protein